MAKKKKATVYDYEAYKKYLQTQNLDHEEYYRKIKEWCDKNKF